MESRVKINLLPILTTLVYNCLSRRAWSVRLNKFATVSVGIKTVKDLLLTQEIVA